MDRFNLSEHSLNGVHSPKAFTQFQESLKDRVISFEAIVLIPLINMNVAMIERIPALIEFGDNLAKRR